MYYYYIHFDILLEDMSNIVTFHLMLVTSLLLFHEKQNSYLIGFVRLLNKVKTHFIC